MSEPELTQDEVDRREERGFVAALQFMTENAAERWPTFQDIFEVHRLIFQDANPGMAGVYRPDTFYPSYIRFPVPSWPKVPACVMQFDKLLEQAKRECDRLTDDELLEAVIEWVARLHHRFERIHPFQDGNGRTGRVSASWMLLHYGLPPFEFGVERKAAYIDALSVADEQVTTQDLEFSDFYPRQTDALTPLISFIIDSLHALTPEQGN